METTSRSTFSPRLARTVRRAPVTAVRTTSLTVPPWAWAAAWTAPRSACATASGPAGADGPVERAARCVRVAAGTQLGGGGPEPAQPRWQPGEGPPAGAEHVDQQITTSRRPSRERRVGVDRGAVDQAAQDGQPADPVREDVVEHHHQRAPASSESGHQCRRPQRSTGPKRPGHRLGDDTHQRMLVAGRSATDGTDMIADVERGVIDPDRPAAPERDVHQPLPQPRYGRDTTLQRLPHGGHIERRPAVENQDGRHLHRRARDVAHQLHHVGRAQTLDTHPCIGTHASESGPHHCVTVEAAGFPRVRESRTAAHRVDAVAPPIGAAAGC